MLAPQTSKIRIFDALKSKELRSQSLTRLGLQFAEEIDGAGVVLKCFRSPPSFK